MGDELTQDAADVVARIGRHWGWVLTFGILTVILALLVLAWPDRTVVVVAVLFGLQLVIAGIFRFVMAFAVDEASGGARVLMALLGVLSFIIGLYALRHILVTIVALALLFGIFWIVHGSIELFAALTQRDLQDRGWIAVLGLLSILVGVIVLVWPAISLTTLAILLGIWLLILGAMEILLAFRLRSVGRIASQIAPAT